MNNRQALLAKAHIAKKDLGLSDDVYRSVLGELFGVDSAGKLSIKQLEALIKHFEKLDWQQKPKARKPSAGGGTRELLGKIEALLAELGNAEGRFVPWTYPQAILKRQGGPERLEWATATQLRAVIAALHKRLKTLEKVSA